MHELVAPLVHRRLEAVERGLLLLVDGDDRIVLMVSARGLLQLPPTMPSDASRPIGVFDGDVLHDPRRATVADRLATVPTARAAATAR